MRYDPHAVTKRVITRYLGIREEQINSRCVKQFIQGLAKHLTPTEFYIFMLREGITTGKVVSFANIATTLSCVKSNVGKSHSNALRKLTSEHWRWANFCERYGYKLVPDKIDLIESWFDVSSSLKIILLQNQFSRLQDVIVANPLLLLKRCNLSREHQLEWLTLAIRIKAMFP